MGDKTRRIRGNDPKFSEARVPRGMRRLDVNGERWLWRVAGSSLEIRDALGVTTTVRLGELLGLSHCGLEDAYEHKQVKVTPSIVADRIRRRVHGYTDSAGYPVGSPGHGLRIPVRQGWLPFEGPRGTWQARCGVWVVDILTPEGVEHQARSYDVLGLDVGAWMGIKIAHLESIGSSLDQMRSEYRAEHGWAGDWMHAWMDYDVPTMPRITPEMLTEHVVRAIVGPAVRAMAA